MTRLNGWRKSTTALVSIFLVVLGLLVGSDSASADDVISTSNAVKVLSKSLQIELTQKDVLRGIMFPSVKGKAQIWSAPYVVVFVYPSTQALKSGLTGFKRDLGNWPGMQHWTYCNNVMVEHPAKYQEAIKKAFAKWCTF